MGLSCFCEYSKIIMANLNILFVLGALCRKNMFIYQGFVFGFLPCAYYICHLPNSHLRAQTRQITEKLAQSKSAKALHDI